MSEERTAPAAMTEEQRSELLQIRRDKLAALQAAGKDPFKITKFAVTHHSYEVKEGFDTLENTEVTVAGRMMSKRIMGKASFCHVQDLKGTIQVYVARDNIGEESYADFKKTDIGDLIGVRGTVFKTKTGEISVHAEEVTLLSKSLQPLPEKFHGLTNTDTRYRQRYVDLIVNPEVRDTFVKRSKIISTVRRFLDARGFMEVETPMLVANAGGAAARPFLSAISHSSVSAAVLPSHASRLSQRAQTAFSISAATSSAPGVLPAPPAVNARRISEKISASPRTLAAKYAFLRSVT